MTTRAQAQSNKNNAKNSTGPKTPEGKKRSSLNSLIHGLRSNEVVLPGEDPAAFEAERAAWFEDWKPLSHTRAVLVERAAIASWRCRRCVRIESQRLTRIGKNAVDHQETETAKRVQAAVALLYNNPNRGLAALESEYDGVVRLIDIWTELADHATSIDAWCEGIEHHVHVMTLLGFELGTDPRAAGEAGLASWRLVLRCHPDEAKADDRPANDDREAARMLQTVQTFLANQIANLKAGLGRFTDPDEFRNMIALQVSVDTSEAGKLLLRYEATHDRSLRASISSLIQLEKSGADLIGVEPEAIAPSEPIGQKPGVGQDLQSVPVVLPTAETSSPHVDTGIETNPEPLPKSDRDRSGRSWEVKDVISALSPS